MVRTVMCTVVALLVAMPAYAADADDVMAPIKAFVAAIDKGDMAAAAAAHVASPGIVDEFPPYHWSSIAAWATDLGKDAAAHGDTGGSLAIVKAGNIRIEGDHAYAVVATDYSYSRKGVPAVEHGTITYALDRTPEGWRIAAWTWTW